jgi:hypothetical protein
MVNKIYNKRKFRKRRNKRNTIKKYKGGADPNISENNTQQESMKENLKNKIKGTKTYQGLAKRAESIKKTGQAINALKKNSMVEFFAEILQYGIFSVVALSVYTPVYLLNIPNTSLENILPKGACKFLFNDEKICKSQIKCLLGFCNDNDELTLLTNVKSKKKEESENEQLEKQQQEPIGATGQTGGKNKKRKYNIRKTQKRKRKNIKQKGGSDSSTFLNRTRKRIGNSMVNTRKVLNYGADATRKGAYRGAVATGKGIISGADAAGKGIYRGTVATGKGITSGFDATKKAAEKSIETMSKDAMDYASRKKSDIEKGMQQTKENINYSKNKMISDASKYVSEATDPMISKGKEISKSASENVNQLNERRKTMASDMQKSMKQGISTMTNEMVDGMSSIKGAAIANRKAMKEEYRKAREKTGTNIGAMDKIVDERFKGVANKMKSGMDRLDDISQKFNKKEDGIDNLNEKTCVNESNDTYCNNRDKVEYGKGARMNGKLYNLVYGETDSKTAERRGEELKTIVGKAYHKFNMSPEKIRVYLDKNVNENNLRMIIELFSMLDIMFADTKINSDVEVDLTEGPEKVKLMFPWETLAGKMNIRQKRQCLMMHLVKNELSDEDFAKDIDPQTGKHRCFYCKKCTFNNTTFKVLNNYFTMLFGSMSSESNDLEGILLSIFNILMPYYERIELSPNQREKLLLINSNIMSEDLNLDVILMNDQQSDYYEYGGNKFHIRNLLTGTKCYKRNKSRPTFEGIEDSMDYIKQAYQMLRKMNFDNICAKLLLAKQYNDLPYESEKVKNTTADDKEKYMNDLIKKRMKYLGVSQNNSSLLNRDILNLKIDLSTLDNRELRLLYKILLSGSDTSADASSGQDELDLSISIGNKELVKELKG